MAGTLLLVINKKLLGWRPSLRLEAITPSNKKLLVTRSFRISPGIQRPNRSFELFSLLLTWWCRSKSWKMQLQLLKQGGLILTNSAPALNGPTSLSRAPTCWWNVGSIRVKIDQMQTWRPFAVTRASAVGSWPYGVKVETA